MHPFFKPFCLTRPAKQTSTRRTALVLISKCLGVGAAAILGGANALGQYAAPPSPSPFSGFINEMLRKNDPYMAAWDFGGNVRLRYEIRENGGATAAGAGGDFRERGVDNDNSYFLSRLRVRAGYTATWFSALVEGRSSATTGDDRNPNPESDGPLDLHQAYVSIGNHKEFPLSVKIGRQELSYGDERVVGAFAWNNIGRVFDAAKVRWQNEYFSADFFTGRVVIPDDNNFNVSNDYDQFSGVYASTKLVPKQTTEVYFLARNASARAASAQPTSLLPLPSARDIYTLGLRAKSNPGELGPWDYGFELMGQLGHYNDPLVTPTSRRSLDHEAYAAVAQLGYTWTDSSMTPRLGLEYSFGSGDSDPADNKHQTFENLFPTNHKFYGYMDFLSLQNIHDGRLSLSCKPTAQMSLAIEGHAFWLAETADSFYNVGGARRGTLTSNRGNGLGYGINPAYSNYLGSEIDLVAGYAVTKYLSLEAGYGHFFVGGYVKQSLSAPARGAVDADWVYLQSSFNF